LTAILEAAGERQLRACERLWHVSWPDLFPGRPSNPDAAFRPHVEGEDIYIARRGGMIAGFVSIWRPDAFIHFLIVDGAWRGQGIGTALLAHALAEMAPPVYLKCGLMNTRAQGFYAARGGREVERVEGGEEPYIRYRFDALPDP
jgi:ribosomal protein S18 acetylase RimI-like enzyme